jgi:hypothetical protein
VFKSQDLLIETEPVLESDKVEVEIKSHHEFLFFLEDQLLAENVVGDLVLEGLGVRWVDLFVLAGDEHGNDSDQVDI